MPLSLSDRINLIRSIATRMAEEEWPMIDLVLQQAGLKTFDEWGGTKSAYVMASMGDADDGTLRQLGEHFGFGVPAAALTVVDPADDRLRIFVTHLSDHRDFAGQLKTELSKFGIEAFVAHDDIVPTAEWQSEIEEELRTCDGLIALLHKDFHNSDWTDQEIGFVMGRDKPVFTVKLGQTPYGFIGRFQAFNGSGKDAKALARELFDTYRIQKQTRQKMSRVVVRLFERAGSFDAARVRVGYLEEIETWDPSYSERIRTAVKQNSQLSGAYGVGDRVKKLVSKWEDA